MGRKKTTEEHKADYELSKARDLFAAAKKVHRQVREKHKR